ncbi:MAG: long-chain-fatty-acid--CoA ligase [Planctomycetota bacterium]
MHPILTPFEANAGSQGQQLAAGDQSLMLEFAAFAAVAQGLAGQIRTQTNAPHVGILAPTSTAGAVAVFACWYAGRVPVPLNFLLSPPELAKIVADAGLDLILAVEHFAPLAGAVGARLLPLNGRTLVPGSLPAPEAAPGDLAAMIYTSGTSAEPKGVRLTFANLAENVRACIEHAKITPDQVLLSVLPQFHSFGFTAMTVLPLMLGATVHYLPRFSPAAVVSAIHEKRASIFMAVASMYAALNKLKSADSTALASLKLAISGGEPLPAAVAETFEARFGVQVNEGYGLTETSPVVSINLPWSRKPGSVGRPLPGVEIAAIDAAGRALPADSEGELVIRGHCVMQGYHNKAEATAAAIVDGGLRTGDIGRVDRDGFVHITGRAKEMLIIAGENVFPREIENVIAAHPAVAEVAVIGTKDDLRGEVPVAFVILNEGTNATDAELRAFCRERIAPYKAPREIRIARELPRGPTGKILKRALKAD